MKKTLTALAFMMTLSAGLPAMANEYCTLPYLNATNIRTACEEYGVSGLQGLYLSNRHIQKLLKTPLKTPAAH